ncbi:MAG: SAM-dependent methyltransferase [Syntrophotaleaceae bacterium]
MNKVWFIGAGPGDPELLTLAGARRLEGCKTVYAFPPFDETFAERLAGKAICNPYGYRFSELVQILEGQLSEGDVAFLVPGDLTFFCPFQALVEVFGKKAEVLPGVGTVNAAAAAMKRTLNLSGSCSRTVIVSTRTLEEAEGAPRLEELAGPGVTLVIYMNHHPLPELVARLRSGYGCNVPIALVHRLGFPGEQLVRGHLDDIEAEAKKYDFFSEPGGKGRSALTLVIVGETLTAPAGSDWWDDRSRDVRKVLEENLQDGMNRDIQDIQD